MTTEHRIQPQRPPILLIEDRDDAAERLSRVLETAGYAARRASTPQIALSLIHTRNPKVVCLRLDLSPTTGLDALREIKRLSPPARVIVYSEAPSLVAAIACMNEGAEIVVRDPIVRPSALIAAIENAHAHLDRWRDMFAELQAGVLTATGSE